MAGNIAAGDFIELDYTGALVDGTIFDTTNEEKAHEANLPHQHGALKPAVICVGEKQLLPGLDAALVGKKVGTEFTVNLTPEDAFGKRDVKKIKIVPISTFKEHKVQPQPGLQIDMDGERGTVQRMAGGRVIVNFNHPLAGKEVTYTARVLRKIDDQKEKVSAYLFSTLRIPQDKFSVDLQEGKAIVTLPMQFPQQVTDILKTKLIELTGVADVEFSTKTSS